LSPTNWGGQAGILCTPPWGKAASLKRKVRPTKEPPGSIWAANPSLGRPKPHYCTQPYCGTTNEGNWGISPWLRTVHITKEPKALQATRFSWPMGHLGWPPTIGRAQTKGDAILNTHVNWDRSQPCVLSNPSIILE